MSLEVVGKNIQEDASGYDQSQIGAAVSTSANAKNSSGTQESRSDKNLRSASSTSTTSANKASIAFNLSFEIKITNRFPVDPNHRC